MEGDGIDDGASRTGGEQEQSPPGLAQPQRPDMATLLRRRYVESAPRILLRLDQLGIRARFVRRAGGDIGQHDAYGDGGFGAVPASSEAIACLPETTAREADKLEECAVCLQSFEEGDRLRTMPCAHGFHESCILTWLGVSRLCPLCRFAVCAADGEGAPEQNRVNLTN